LDPRNRFLKGQQLSRSEIWSSFYRGTSPKPKGGNWDTGYVVEGDELIAFLNINSVGRTGHDFPNEYNPEDELVTWFGKPGTHSRQNIFKRLLSGELVAHIFARWSNKNVKFLYLGKGKVVKYQDDVEVENGKTALKMWLSVGDPDLDSIGSEGVTDHHAVTLPSFGKRMSVVVNRYERDPQKRQECLDANGFTCKICGFSFLDFFGELGRDFCHVHHVEPIGERGGEYIVNAKTDLIPVCANCHAMLHRKTPALKPDELRQILAKKSLDH